MTNLRFDKGEFKGSVARTDEGYVRGEAIITRTGVFLYQNKDGSIRRELRHPDDVFARDSLETLKMLPITNDHPATQLIDAQNADTLQIGQTGETVNVDGRYVLSTLNITHKDGIAAIDSGRKELSLGYKSQVIKEDGVYNGERYDHRQTNIRYNHLAIVDRARAGAMARINLDSGDAIQVENQPQTRSDGMENLVTVNLDGLEYKASPEVLKHIKRLDADLEKEKKDNEGEKSKYDEMKKKFDELSAERDSLKEKMDEMKSKNNDSAIREAAKTRVDLERKASRLLDSDTIAKLDSLDDLDIMKAAIARKSPKAVLDGKSEDYIKARFDAAIEDLGEQRSDANAHATTQTTTVQDGVVSLAKARADALDAMTNAWNKK
jgi:hypothetical protein